MRKHDKDVESTLNIFRKANEANEANDDLCEKVKKLAERSWLEQKFDVRFKERYIAGYISGYVSVLIKRGIEERKEIIRSLKEAQFEHPFVCLVVKSFNRGLEAEIEEFKLL